MVQTPPAPKKYLALQTEAILVDEQTAAPSAHGTQVVTLV